MEKTECHECKWRLGQHDPACPNVQEDKKKATVAYTAGWTAGRKGSKPASDNPTYMLGYGLGENALESFQNGYDPRFGFD